MIERSWVPILAGEFSSPGSTLCADSDFGMCFTQVLPQWHVKVPVILPKAQVAGYN